MRSLRLAAGWAALLLSGCALGPQYERPALDLPESWPESQAPMAVAAGSEWWHRFGDPALDGLVARALADNLDLRLAAARVAEARARLGFARAEEFPSIALQAEATRQRQPAAALGIEGLEIPPRNVFSVAGTLAYEVDLWGRLARQREAADAQLRRSAYTQEAVRVALVADVVSGYYSLLAAREQLAVTERTVASRQENVRVQRLRFDAGMIDELALRQAEAELAAVLAQLPGRIDAVQRRESALGILVGLTPAELLAGIAAEPGNLERAAGPAAIPAVLPAELLARRPDLRAVEASLEAATAGVGVAMAARLPQLNLAALLGSTAADVGDLFGADAEAWRVGGGLAGPLLDFGRGRAGVETAEAQREQAELQYRAAVAAAVAEVRDGLRAYDNALATLAAVERQVAALRRTEVLAEIRYREGYVSIVELLDAQRALLAAELVLAEAQANRFVASATLYKSLGGDWEEGTW